MVIISTVASPIFATPAMTYSWSVSISQFSTIKQKYADNSIELEVMVKSELGRLENIEITLLCMEK